MNQCVPSWEVEENHQTPSVQRIASRDHSSSSSLTPDVPSLEYEVAELTWENGQLAMHGLGPPRLTFKTPSASTPVKYTWVKQPTAAVVSATAGGGTLESVVNQATTNVPGRKPTGQDDAACGGGGGAGDDELVPWFTSHQRQLQVSANSHTLTMDALVPSSNKTRIINDGEACSRVPGVSTRVVGCSGTHVGSCRAATVATEQADERLARVGSRSAHPPDRSSSRSVSGSATCGRDSRQVTVDTCERDIVTPWLNSASLGSPENTSSGKRCTKTGDDYDSACHSRNEREAGEEKKRGNVKSCISAKRSRAAAIHNLSERKRRDKINQRMKTLQKLVPNSSKNSHTDKASMLDEVIEYLKQLQAQVHIMSRMSMPWMMLPLALQQQLQMSMMPPMGLGMNMGVGMGMGMSMGTGMGVMDLNSMARPNIPGIPPIIHPNAFMLPATSWDGGLGDRVAAAALPPSAMPDPLAAFLACQSQPMTMDAYGRMAALYQQCFQQPPDPACCFQK